MQTVRVDGFDAFLVNTVGPAAFPLSMSVEECGGVWSVHATAARACDVVDVLGVGAQGTAVVLNVGQNSWLADDWTPWPLRQIALRQGVAFTAHDIRWAASPRFRPDDLLIVAWPDLRRFLDGWSHHDIEILDVPGPLQKAEADELALIVNTHEVATCLLPRLPGSRVYYSGHDDCYLHVESTDSRLPVRLLTRLLARFAGSALLGDGAGAVAVPEPDDSLAAALLRACNHWVAGVVDDPGRTVTLGLVPSDKAWRLSDPIPDQVSTRVVLDVGTGGWSVLPR